MISFFMITLILFMFNSAFSITCKENDCFCPNGDAVPKTSLCDGKIDCGGKFDEADEICSFKCNDTANTMVSRLRFGLPGQVCDGTKDCPNGDDEVNCDVGQQYTCGDGKLVSIDKICDHKNDCLDGLDESGCAKGFSETLKCSKFSLKPSLATVKYAREDGGKAFGTATIICNGTVIGQLTCNNGVWRETCRDSTCWSYFADESTGYYKAYISPLNFENAKNKCAANCGQLITVHSEKEANHAIEIFKTASPPAWIAGTWIGMKRGPNGGKTTAAKLNWIDGTPVTYKGKFLASNPSCDTCVRYCDCIDCMEILLSNREWNDIPCTVGDTRATTCAVYIEIKKEYYVYEPDNDVLMNVRMKDMNAIKAALDQLQQQLNSKLRK